MLKKHCVEILQFYYKPRSDGLFWIRPNDNDLFLLHGRWNTILSRMQYRESETTVELRWSEWAHPYRATLRTCSRSACWGGAAGWRGRTTPGRTARTPPERPSSDSSGSILKRKRNKIKKLWLRIEPLVFLVWTQFFTTLHVGPICDTNLSASGLS